MPSDAPAHDQENTCRYGDQGNDKSGCSVDRRIIPDREIRIYGETFRFVQNKRNSRIDKAAEQTADQRTDACFDPNMQFRITDDDK